MGLKGTFPLLLAQNPVSGEELVSHAAEGRAAGVELLRQKAAGHVGFAKALGVETPALLPVAFIPEVALGAGHSGCACHAQGLGGQTRCLWPDAHWRGPGKGRRLATGTAAEGVVAKADLGKLDPGLKGFCIDMLRLIHVPELQKVAVVQVGGALGLGLYQNTRGSGVAYVKKWFFAVWGES